VGIVAQQRIKVKSLSTPARRQAGTGRKDFPKLPSATSFIRKTLGESVLRNKDGDD